MSNEVIFSARRLSGDRQSAGHGDPGKRLFPGARPIGPNCGYQTVTFHLDRRRQVVIPDGNPFEPHVTIPPLLCRSPSPPTDTVSYTHPGQTAAQQAGQIQLASFPNPGWSEQSRRQTFIRRPTPPAHPMWQVRAVQDGHWHVLAGLPGRQSNVRVGQEFMNLIVSQRAYEANSKVVKAADEIYQQVNNLKQ